MTIEVLDNLREFPHPFQEVSTKQDCEICGFGRDTPGHKAGEDLVLFTMKTYSKSQGGKELR